MSATPSITTIWPAHCSEFIAHEMFDARATMSAATKYPNSVNKIALFQNSIFAMNCKYIS
jgi:hypothetical protein